MWDEIAEMFDRALELPPSQRQAWLDAACVGREAVRREVAAMLLADEPLEIERQLLAAIDTRFAEGTRLGNYRIVRVIGEGGMGEVYLGAREDFDQFVAIKVLRVHVPDAAARFRRERRILAHLTHPSIVPLLDSGIAPDGRPFLVLQYVEGEPITRWCVERELGVDARLRLFVDVCRAVQYAHGRLIIHRDLKPSNILVTAEGEPRLLDFGIAKALAAGDEAETELTHHVAAPMTPERAAPEQLRGERPSTATDVWALGVLLCELLTGRLPFDVAGRSRTEIERAITGGEPERLGLRGDLKTVVTVALRREPEQRYASAGQLADDVERVLAGQPILARPHGLGYRMRRFIGRNRAAVIASTLALVSLIVFAVTTAMQSRQVARERDRAAAEEVKANAVVDLFVEVLGGANPAEGGRSPTVDVDELLGRAETRARELDEQPDVQARLWHVLGQIQSDRSNFDKARELLGLALARQIGLAGPDDARATEMALDLAMTEWRIGLREDAERRVRDVVTRLERAPGRDAALLAQAVDQLGMIVKGGEGERLVQRALALRRTLDPPRPVAVAESLNDLGVLAHQRGDWAAAARYWRESLALVSTAQGADHPDTLSVKGNLAVVTSDPAEQIALYRGLIAAHEKRLGRSSMLAANMWNNLGTAMATQGDLEAAADAYETALEQWVEIFDRNHPQALTTRRSMAKLDELTGRNEKAVAELRAVIAAARLANEPVLHCSVRTQLSSLLLRLGRLDEAEHEAHAALEELTRIAPEGAPARTAAQFNHGMVLLARGRAADAVTEMRPAVALVEKRLPADDPRVGEAQVGLGRALVASGRVAEGRALIEKAFPVFSRAGTSHPDDVAAAKKLLSASPP